MEAIPERTYILRLGEDILDSIDGKKKKGSPVVRQTHSAGRGPPAQHIASRADLPDETMPLPDLPKGKDSAGVPTTLEGLFSTGEEKSAHEVLGLLVDSHIKEAEAILGRTNLQRHE